MVLAAGWVGLFLRLYDGSKLWPNALNAYYILRFPGFALGQGLSLIPASRYGVDLLWLTLFFSTAALLGRLLLSPLRLRGLDFFEELLFGLGVGLGAFALLGLLLGVSGLLYPNVMLGIFAALGLAGLAYNVRYPPHAPAFKPGKPAWHVLAAVSIILVLAKLNLLGAMGPEIFYDALVYHLALPQLYLTKHAIVATPYNIYSGVPFNAEMLYLWGLALRGEGLAKLLPWGLSLALVLSLWAFGRRFASSSAGWLAAALLYSCPMFSMETWNALVEIHWCFFNFLALFSLLIGLDKQEDGWLLLSGVLAGFALGVKYNAFPTVAVLLALIFFFQRRLKGALLCAGPALLLFLPWTLKNFFFYHNPVFPFFHELFAGAGGPDWQGLLADAKSRNLTATFTTAAGFKDLFLVFFSREWLALDSLGAALLLGMPGIFLARRSAPSHRRLLAAFLLSWAAWSFSSRMPRFFIFALPLWALLLATAAEEAKPWARRLALAALFTACLINCGEIFNNWFGMGGWRVVLGGQSKADYLDHNRGMYPSPYYAGMEFVNEKLPLGSKILFVGEHRDYYCERDFLSHSLFVKPPLAQWAEQAKSAEALRDKVLAEGITHLFINRIEVARVGYLSMGPEAQKRFEGFARHTRQVFEKRRADAQDPMWVQIYEVVRPPAS